MPIGHFLLGARWKNYSLRIFFYDSQPILFKLLSSIYSVFFLTPQGGFLAFTKKLVWGAGAYLFYQNIIFMLGRTLYKIFLWRKLLDISNYLFISRLTLKRRKMYKPFWKLWPEDLFLSYWASALFFPYWTPPKKGHANDLFYLLLPKFSIFTPTNRGEIFEGKRIFLW